MLDHFRRRRTSFAFLQCLTLLFGATRVQTDNSPGTVRSLHTPALIALLIFCFTESLECIIAKYRKYHRALSNFSCNFIEPRYARARETGSIACMTGTGHSHGHLAEARNMSAKYAIWQFTNTARVVTDSVPLSYRKPRPICCHLLFQHALQTVPHLNYIDKVHAIVLQKKYNLQLPVKMSKGT